MDKNNLPQRVVTVIICTFNRAKLVCRCLEALDRQTISPELFTVVVVDNGSTDDTKRLVTAHMATAPYVLKLVEEAKQGTSYARNHGARASATAWLAFLDDDVRPHADWLSEILEFIAHHPDAAIFGGPYFPDYLDPPPAWLPAEVGRFWHGDTVVRLPYRKHFLAGGNLMVRRDIFQSLGGFNPALGPHGLDFHYGEDTAFYRQAISQGHAVYYTPRPVVDHLVRPEKYRLAWHAVSLRELGRNLFRRLGPVAGIPACLCLVAASPLLAICNFCIFLDIPYKRRIYFALHPLCYAWGMLFEAATCLIRPLHHAWRRAVAP